MSAPANFDDFAPERDQQHFSIGYMCGWLQILPGQLKVLMEDCDVHFSIAIDGIGYVSLDDAETLGAKCREVRAEIESAMTSHERN